MVPTITGALYLITRRLEVWVEPAHSAVYHPQRLLEGLLEPATQRHDFTDRLHRAADLRSKMKCQSCQIRSEDIRIDFLQLLKVQSLFYNNLSTLSSKNNNEITDNSIGSMSLPKTRQWRNTREEWPGKKCEQYEYSWLLSYLCADPGELPEVPARHLYYAVVEAGLKTRRRLAWKVRIWL